MKKTKLNLQLNSFPALKDPGKELRREEVKRELIKLMTREFQHDYQGLRKLLGQEIYGSQSHLREVSISEGENQSPEAEKRFTQLNQSLIREALNYRLATRYLQQMVKLKDPDKSQLEEREQKVIGEFVFYIVLSGYFDSSRLIAGNLSNDQQRSQLKKVRRDFQRELRELFTKYFGREDELEALEQNIIETLVEDIFGLQLLVAGPRRDLTLKFFQKFKEAFPYQVLNFQNQVIIEGLVDDIIGLGPVERFMHEHEKLPGYTSDRIEDIMINGHDRIFIKRADGSMELARDELQNPIRFDSQDHLRNIVNRLLARMNKRVDENNPLVDARLPTGERVNVVIPPLTADGRWAVTIRLMPDEPLSWYDLFLNGTWDIRLAAFLAFAVRARLNILISGSTGAGKTTLLNVLSSFIQPAHRVVTIEDVGELNLQKRVDFDRLTRPPSTFVQKGQDASFSPVLINNQLQNIVPLETRPSNVEGRAEYNVRELVRNALRMRPERIIVGEVRSGEAFDMLQALNTGHDGSLTTIHANNSLNALNRLENLVLMAGYENLDIGSVRSQVLNAFNLVVHIGASPDGARRIEEVWYIHDSKGLDLRTPEVYQGAGELLFRYEPITGGEITYSSFSSGFQALFTRSELAKRFEQGYTSLGLIDQGLNKDLPFRVYLPPVFETFHDQDLEENLDLLRKIMAFLAESDPELAEVENFAKRVKLQNRKIAEKRNQLERHGRNTFVPENVLKLCWRL